MTPESYFIFYATGSDIKHHEKKIFLKIRFRTNNDSLPNAFCNKKK